MKMRFCKEFALALLVFAVAVIIPQEVLSAVLTADVASVLDPGTVFTGMAVVSLANLDGSSEGVANPGGTRSLYIISKNDVSGVWPKAADVTTGEITVLPTMVTGKKFAEYKFPDGTFELGDEKSGEPGYQAYKHTVGFSQAGFSKSLIAELQKHLNAGSIVIAQLNDSVLAVAGSSDNPIYLKSNFKSGKKGNDKRGYDLKGEQDGFMWGILPLSSTIASTLPLLTVAAP
ncbi:MAG: hypothetical protein J7576_18500 [Siphonobacter aquaeclarae]|nr:hypothetical protein [Siphonobacter aquaeclarae]